MTRHTQACSDCIRVAEQAVLLFLSSVLALGLLILTNIWRPAGVGSSWLQQELPTVYTSPGVYGHTFPLAPSLGTTTSDKLIVLSYENKAAPGTVLVLRTPEDSIHLLRVSNSWVVTGRTRR